MPVHAGTSQRFGRPVPRVPVATVRFEVPVLAIALIVSPQCQAHVLVRLSDSCDVFEKSFCCSCLQLWLTAASCCWPSVADMQMSALRTCSRRQRR